MKYVLLSVAAAGLLVTGNVRAISTNDIQIWAGHGTNHAAVVIEWSAPEFFNNTAVPAPAANKTMVWGYEFNGTATAKQMFDAVLAADKRLYMVIAVDPEFGTELFGVGYNLSGNGIYGVSDGTTTDTQAAFVRGYLNDPNLALDAARPVNTGDLFWCGDFGPNWIVWNELNGAGGYSASPDRGPGEFATLDTNTYAWTQGQWESAFSGLDYLYLQDGSWVGLTVGAAGYDYNPTNATAIAYNDQEQAPPSPDGTYAAYVCNTNDFAVQVISSSNVDAMYPYNDITAVLGPPTLTFVDPSEGDATNRVSIVDDPFNIAPNGSNVIAKIDNNGSATFLMGRKVYHNPANPYGIDLIVYGNSFYQASGFIDDDTDLDSTALKAAGGHPTIVSVSQDGASWYTFATTSVLFPDDAYRWDDDNHSWTGELMNPNKPLDPAISEASLVGGTAAAALDKFVGASGGTGYSLQASGLPWIQYVRIQPGSNTYTVIDAIAAVNTPVEGDALSISPVDLTHGVTNLSFQAPYDSSKTEIALGFSSLSQAARVSTVALSDFRSFAPAPGNIENACQMNVAPISGATPVSYAANAALAAGNYLGDGSDLRVLAWGGTNWDSLAFSYNAASNQVCITGQTNLSAVVISQLSPEMCIQSGASGVRINFTAFASVAYVLERSCDLLHWNAVNTNTATAIGPVTMQDPAPPSTAAFYRLHLFP
jgi:hypothetical protein